MRVKERERMRERVCEIIIRTQGYLARPELAAVVVVAAAETVAGKQMAAAVVAGILMAAAAKWSCCLATVHPTA